MSNELYQGPFFESFDILQDTREEGKVHHKLIDILFIAISAVICGCNDWKEIHVWATMELNKNWLKKYLELPNGIPSMITIWRVFNRIIPEQLEKCFSTWMKSVVALTPKDIIPIDGKTMRGSQEKSKGGKGIHIVSALCRSNNLVLGQVKTEEKSNEITAIPELLDLLYIKGCIVSIDAMGTQRKIAEKIVEENKADYVLSLKGNQQTLHDEVEGYFEDLEKSGVIKELKEHKESGKGKEKFQDGSLDMLTTVEKGHGRIEKRTYYFSTDTDWMIDAKKDWKKLTGLGRVEREVEVISSGEKTFETCEYICSIDNVRDFAAAVRGHWGIESMHWSLDLTFRDDENKTRKGKGAQNLAALKRIAFNTVKADTVKRPKESMKIKRFIASMDFGYRDYLININFKER